MTVTAGDRGRTARQGEQLAPGTRVGGRYEVLSLLGGGELGLRYACADWTENRSVALREYFPKALCERAAGTVAVSPRDGASGERFVRGANAFYDVYSSMCGVVGSTDVEDVRSCFFENGTAYAVSDLYEGVNLKDYLLMRRQPLSEGELIYLAEALSDALIVIHSLNIVHGDIRAENVFLRRDGTAKLIDFGAPRRVVRGLPPEERPEEDILQLGKLLFAAGGERLSKDAGAQGGDIPAGSVAALISRMAKDDLREGFCTVFELKHAINCVETVRVRPAVPTDLAARYEKRLADEAREKRKKRVIFAAFAAAALLLIGVLVFLLVKRG